MKTISVSNCGECPFLNRDSADMSIAHSDCNGHPAPTQAWSCSATKIPAECPLRVEVIAVQVKP